jgi:hypothetical protein
MIRVGINCARELHGTRSASVLYGPGGQMITQHGHQCFFFRSGLTPQNPRNVEAANSQSPTFPLECFGGH